MQGTQSLRATAACLVLVCGSHAIARAAESSQPLPAVHVTASRLPVADLPVSQSVIVLSGQDIAARAPDSMPDLLRGISDLHVDQAGAPSGFSSLYLRGADPSHTVILIDGVKVNDPTNTRGGGVDMALVDPQTIDRIEILPGASSAIYGADAIAGVINIITRRADATGAHLGAGVGGHGYRTARMRANLPESAVSLAGDVATADDGHRSGDSFKRLRTGGLRLDAGSAADAHLTASLRLQQHKSGSFPDDSGGPLYSVRRELELRETDSVIGSLKGGMHTPWGTFRFYGTAFSQDADIDTPGVAPGVRDPFGLPRTLSDARYRRWTLGAISVFGEGEHAPLLVGLEYEREQGDLASTLLFDPVSVPANFSLARQTHSAFTEGHLNLNERFTLQAGARADDTEAYGTKISVRTGLRYKVTEARASVALNVGTGFKPPSFFALGHPIVGNSNLRPEESRTIEFAIATDDAGNPLTQRAALFRSRYQDLVDFDAGPPPQLVNRSKVDIQGVSYSATATVNPKFRAGGTITALDFDVPNATTPLRNRPRLRAAANTAVDIAPHTTLTLDGSWNGRVFDSSIPTGDVYLSPYLVVDAALSYARRGTRLTFALDNVLDRDYQQFVGFTGTGRRARFEVAFDL